MLITYRVILTLSPLYPLNHPNTELVLPDISSVSHEKGLNNDSGIRLTAEDDLFHLSEASRQKTRVDKRPPVLDRDELFPLP